jgi:hypothetical protein
MITNLTQRYIKSSRYGTFYIKNLFCEAGEEAEELFFWGGVPAVGAEVYGE